MSDTALYLSLALVACVFAAILGFIFYGRHRNRQRKGGYRWKPEQDYDVVIRGETPMTPGFPVLKKRDRK